MCESESSDELWEARWKEIMRVTPVRDGKLEKRVAQQLPEEAVVMVVDKEKGWNAVGSVWILREAGVWDFERFDVYNVTVPQASLKSES